MQEQDRRKKEQRRLEQEQEANKAAEAKRLAKVETDRQNQLAKQDEAAASHRAYIEHHKQLLETRRKAVSQDKNNEHQPISFQIALLILAINALLSAVFAVIAALTIIGIPVAIGLAINFALSTCAYCVVVMINNIRHASNEAVAHLRFQSSLLLKQVDADRYLK